MSWWNYTFIIRAILTSVFDSAIFATSIQYRLAACHEGFVAAVMAVNPAAWKQPSRQEGRSTGQWSAVSGQLVRSSESQSGGGR